MEKTVEAMEKLGVYRPEYEQSIAIYSNLLEQYERLKKKVTNEDFIKRNDCVLSLENLRKDIAKYSDMLCLNPRTFEKINVKEPQKVSKLEDALGRIDNG